MRAASELRHAPLSDMGVEAVLQWLSSCWYSAENDMCSCGRQRA